MPTLALLSHQDPQFGTAMYERLRQLLPAQRPRMAYLELDDLTEITDNFTPELLPKLHDYDGLHLSGGQTPRFLSLLRQHQLLPELRAFAQAGGVLAGVSAGAILLTPTIDTAQSVGDDFTGADAERTALGLVDFHFWPHSVPSDEPAAQAQARELGRPIYAAEDGGGVIVRGGEVSLVGPVKRFGK